MTCRSAQHRFRGGPILVRPGAFRAAAAAAAIAVGAAGGAPDAARLEAAVPCCAQGPLADSIAAATAGLPDAAQIGVLAVSIDRGDTLVAQNEARRMVPGSNVKIFTTAAFLSRFGPEARFPTVVEARGSTSIGKEGRVRLKGDLVLRPSGTPDVTQLLSPGSRGLLDSLAFLLHEGGLAEFQGTLWIDGTLFAPEPYAPGWAIDDAAAAYAAPVGAVLANGNAATLVATGGARRAALALEPPETPLEIVSRVRLGGPGVRGWLDAERYPGSRRLRASGIVPRGGQLKKQVAISEPDSTAGLWLLGALRRAGVKTRAVVRLVPHEEIGSEEGADGPVARRGGGAAPPPAPAGESGWGAVRKDRSATVLAFQSPPASDFVGVVSAWSLNMESEALLRMLDPAPRGKRRALGIAEVRRAAAAWGVDTLDLAIVDGSGLSPMNLATARAIVSVLAGALRDERLGAVYPGSLAEPGAQGTLKTRFAGLDSAADLHAKTGTLTNVSSLSGYVRSADGERIAFAILSNGVRGGAGAARQMEERLARAFSRFTRPARGGRGAPPTIPR